MSEMWNTLRLLDARRHKEPATEDESKKAYRALMAAIAAGLPSVEKEPEPENRTQEIPKRRPAVI